MDHNSPSTCWSHPADHGQGSFRTVYWLLYVKPPCMLLKGGCMCTPYPPPPPLNSPLLCVGLERRYGRLGSILSPLLSNQESAFCSWASTSSSGTVRVHGVWHELAQFFSLFALELGPVPCHEHARLHAAAVAGQRGYLEAPVTKHKLNDVIRTGSWHHLLPMQSCPCGSCALSCDSDGTHWSLFCATCRLS